MGHWRQAQTGLQRFPRVSTEAPVRVTTVDAEIDPDTGKTFFRSAEETTANLSRGGAYVRSWEPLAAGRRVIVVISLPRGEEIQLEGRVAWTRRELRPQASRGVEVPGYGVEFAQESTIELFLLDRYLTSVEPRDAQAPRAETGPATPQP